MTCGIGAGLFARRMGCRCMTLSSRTGWAAEGIERVVLWDCRIRVVVLVAILMASESIAEDTLLAVRFAVRQARHVESSSCGGIAVRSKQQTRVGIGRANV